MMPRRYRILVWVVPVLVVQWIATMAIGLDGPGGYVSIGFFLGSLYGHATLSAAWAALGSGPVRWRLPLSLVWVAALPVAVAVNIATHHGPGGGVVVIGACLFGQWLLVQLLLWPLAIGYGLRIRYLDDWDTMPDRRERQFSVRHLMLFTAVVGVIFGAGRILLGWLGESYGLGGEGPIFVFLAVAAVLLTLPLLLAGLLAQRAIPAVLLVSTLIALATAWELTLLETVVGKNGPGPETGHFISINAFTAATILVGVLIVRLNGYGVGARGKLQTEGGTA